MGYGSTAMIYGHVLVFDFFRCLGHSNAEVVPHEVFNKLPLLGYFIYTPTKKREGTGFCVPSTCGGHNVGNAYTVCVKIICVDAILHEDVSVTVLATYVYHNASDVGLV
ncbi:hypothetical protein Goklo_001854 [Gossypium klotzschianum]|uniref:Uncharacterized protein n=1 Tax=Gossypium klotzschianum TaxID=34286 RepID=A0A7J8W2Y7_9ROSI|nr:hypothetical protein [Gossypium klotzschianum]